MPVRRERKSLKAQTEIVNMTIFLLIAVILLFSVFFWGNSVIGSNSDEANLFASEQFMQKLGGKIEDVAKNGGAETLQMRTKASLTVLQGNIIEYSFQGKNNIPDDWIYIYGDDAAEVNVNEPAAVIRERKDNDRIRIQLYYRNRTGANKYLIYPFIGGGGLGSAIRIENNGTVFSGDLVMSMIKLTV